MIPEPLCKLLVVADSSCGVKRLWRAVYTLEDLLRSTPSSTPPSLPRAEGTAQPQHRFVPVFTLPWFLGQPLESTRSHLDPWWESLALTLSQEVGCKFATFFDEVVITQMPFCLGLLFQCVPTAAFPVPRYVPARRCGLYVLLFPVKSIFFPHKHLRNAVACRDRTHFCIFSIV